MNFDEWWDTLPNQLPSSAKAKMRLAWQAGRLSLANDVMDIDPSLKGTDADCAIQRALDSGYTE